MSIPIDPNRAEAQARRVKELRAEAEYHQRRVDNFNAQADVIERTWGIAEKNSSAEADVIRWVIEGNYRPGRVMGTPRVVRGPHLAPGQRVVVVAASTSTAASAPPEGPPAYESFKAHPLSGRLDMDSQGE